MQQSTKLLTPQRTVSGSLANRNLAVLEKSTEEVAKINNLSTKLIKPNIVDHVIQETFMRAGRFTSKHTLTSDQALEAGMRFLGKGYRQIGNSERGIFRSLDGLRQFRIDPGSISGKRNSIPHFHLEIFKRNGNSPYINNHIPFHD